MTTRNSLTWTLSALSLWLGLGLLAPQLPADAKGVKLPNRGAPPSTASGGTRSSCIASAKPLTALIPERTMGFTVADQPTFMVYVPETQAKTAEFVLRDSQEQEVYRTTLPVPKSAGIVSLKFPQSRPLPTLATGKDYHWYFALVCKPDDRREDVFVDAWIHRADTNPALSRKLSTASLEERSEIYAKAGAWYEALNTLAELRRTRPNDAAIAADWKDLLTSVGLGEIASEPILGSATQTALSPQ